MQLLRRIGLFPMALVLLFVPGTSRGEISGALSAFEKVECFSFGRVGVAGVMSPGDKLFRELAAAPNRAELFHILWSEGNSQAKCYALVGLYWLKDPAADQCAQQLISSGVPVVTARGCSVGAQEQPGAIVDTIKSGEYLEYYFPDLLKKAK